MMEKDTRDLQGEDKDVDFPCVVPALFVRQQHRRLPTKFKVALIAFLATLLFCIVTGITLVLCDVFTHKGLSKHKDQPLVQGQCHDRDPDNNCVCNQGFIEVENSYCEDIDECMQLNCSINQFCLNTPGSYQCQCKSGFKMNNDTSCVDVNECQENIDNCHTNATCSNTQGSYACKCKQGFRGDGWICVDTNECQIGIHQCHIHAECFNTIGSYTCKCNDGFRGDGWTCVDINECQDGSHYCSANAHCVNLVGSHNCSCNTGFAGDGFNCIDIDECLSTPCHKHAACTNHHGNYSCSCNYGYKGSGFLCKKNAGSTVTSHPSLSLIHLLLLVSAWSQFKLEGNI